MIIAGLRGTEKLPVRSDNGLNGSSAPSGTSHVRGLSESFDGGILDISDAEDLRSDTIGPRQHTDAYLASLLTGYHTKNLFISP